MTLIKEKERRNVMLTESLPPTVFLVHLSVWSALGFSKDRGNMNMFVWFNSSFRVWFNTSHVYFLLYWTCMKNCYRLTSSLLEYQTIHDVYTMSTEPNISLTLAALWKKKNSSLLLWQTTNHKVVKLPCFVFSRIQSPLLLATGLLHANNLMSFIYMHFSLTISSSVVIKLKMWIVNAYVY